MTFARRTRMDPGDPYWPSVSLMLSGDGANAGTNFPDLSKVGSTVTPAGNAQTSTAQKKFLSASASFDGTNSKLTVPDAASLQFGTGALTVEAWIYLSSGTSRGIIGKGVTGGWFMRVNSTPVFTLICAAGTFNGVTTVTTGAWHHVAWCRAGTGTNQSYLFLDGAVERTFTDASNYNQTDSLIIGADRAGTAQWWPGYTQQIRLTKGVARYTAAFTPSARPFPLH